MPTDALATPSATGRSSAVDHTVCEWAIDAGRSMIGLVGPEATTSLASRGFVDFDVIETIRVPSTAATRP